MERCLSTLPEIFTWKALYSFMQNYAPPHFAPASLSLPLPLSLSLSLSLPDSAAVLSVSVYRVYLLYVVRHNSAASMPCRDEDCEACIEGRRLHTKE